MSDSLWPMDCSLPGPSNHGISQARILKWIAISFSRGSSQSGDWTQVGSLPTEPQELSPKSYLHLDTYLSGHHLYTKKTSFLSFVSHLMAISSPKKKQQNTFKDFMWQGVGEDSGLSAGFTNQLRDGPPLGSTRHKVEIPTSAKCRIDVMILLVISHKVNHECWMYSNYIVPGFFEI